MIIQVDIGGQPRQRNSFSEQSLFPHSTPGNRGLQDSFEADSFEADSFEADSFEAPASPATAQQQREYARARKARKQAQKKRAKDLPPKPKREALDIPKWLLEEAGKIVGADEIKKAQRTVIAKRKAFLSAVEGTGAARFDGRYMAVDTSKLGDEQLALLHSYCGGI